MKKSLKNRIYEIIFEADTRAGKTFDILLLIIILLSVVIVILESVPWMNAEYKNLFRKLEWIITLLFTIEYFLRIWVVKHPRKYIFSFFGIIDFLSILPSYLGVLLTGAHSLIILRALRLLRVFRILKLTRYLSESQLIMRALIASRKKIGVFLFSIVVLLTIVGTMMYLIEGNGNSGFTSIPRSIYWAVVTLTTVGYGDISPQTPLGQLLASFIMIMGYSIIAVPTGIVTAEFNRARIETPTQTQVCPNCLYSHHDDDAIYCKKCGSAINPHEKK